MTTSIREGLWHIHHYHRQRRKTLLTFGRRFVLLCLVHPSKSAADAPGAHTHLIPHMFPQMIPDSIACRLYVLIVLVETAVDLGIESDLLVRFHEAGKADDETVSRKMPVYLGIFALAQYVLRSAFSPANC